MILTTDPPCAQRNPASVRGGRRLTRLPTGERKGWPLESVRAELSHDRVHARDCKDCEGDLDSAQRERLAYIATRCPVRKTLAAGPHITDEVI